MPTLRSKKKRRISRQRTKPIQMLLPKTKKSRKSLKRRETSWMKSTTSTKMNTKNTRKRTRKPPKTHLKRKRFFTKKRRIRKRNTQTRSRRLRKAALRRNRTRSCKKKPRKPSTMKSKKVNTLERPRKKNGTGTKSLLNMMMTFMKPNTGITIGILLGVNTPAKTYLTGIGHTMTFPLLRDKTIIPTFQCTPPVRRARHTFWIILRKRHLNLWRSTKPWPSFT
mmetsp:Transcript_2406/g.6914  ORF Transcript_2406/g.6914 Transcript_2406/m.6914 type:complete len:223 (+) Transcript_2406:427-1095(+)